MTKRLHFTLEEVLEDVLSDDEDLDDDEPMMEGSDEFSDQTQTWMWMRMRTILTV